MQVQSIITDGKFRGVDIATLYALGMVMEEGDVDMRNRANVLISLNQWVYDDAPTSTEKSLLRKALDDISAMSKTGYLDSLDAMGDFADLIAGRGFTFEDIPDLINESGSSTANQE